MNKLSLKREVDQFLTLQLQNLALVEEKVIFVNLIMIHIKNIIGSADALYCFPCLLFGGLQELIFQKQQIHNKLKIK